jgi:hypothetical protein
VYMLEKHNVEIVIAEWFFYWAFIIQMLQSTNY